jgi:two-component system, NarL family, response regulator YdfI
VPFYCLRMLDQDPMAPPPRALEPARQLSARQLEVLEMVSRGLTNHEIATLLHLSVHAVKFHLASIYEKLGVSNRTEAAVTYLKTSA